MPAHVPPPRRPATPFDSTGRLVERELTGTAPVAVSAYLVAIMGYGVMRDGLAPGVPSVGALLEFTLLVFFGVVCIALLVPVVRAIGAVPVTRARSDSRGRLAQRAAIAFGAAFLGAATIEVGFLIARLVR